MVSIILTTLFLGKGVNLPLINESLEFRRQRFLPRQSFVVCLAGWSPTHTRRLFLVVILVKLSGVFFSTMKFPVYIPFVYAQPSRSVIPAGRVGGQRVNAPHPSFSLCCRCVSWYHEQPSTIPPHRECHFGVLAGYHEHPSTIHPHCECHFGVLAAPHVQTPFRCSRRPTRTDPTCLSVWGKDWCSASVVMTC